MTTYTLSIPVAAEPSDESFWLQDTADYAPSFPAFDGAAGASAAGASSSAASADVAVVGAGLTGLWTAIRLRQRHPELSVVVLEAHRCGSGASGRNGGQVHSWFESLDRLAAVTDREEALRLARASVEAIDELRALQDSGELDMDLRLDGWLWTASSRAQEGAWGDSVARGEAAGVTRYTPLGRAALDARVGTSASYVGVAEEGGGSLHPGKLMRSLARYADRLGVRIHENTPVSRIDSDDRRASGAGRGSGDGRRAGESRLHTPGGIVRARSVLLATNVWASSIPELRRRMFVVDSEVIATAAVPERLDSLGWTGGEAVCDAQQQVLYYQRTVDGRVVFGRGSGRTIFRDRVTGALNRRPGRAVAMRETIAEFRRVYPQLADIEIDYDWTGGIDCVPSHVPQFGRLAKSPGVFYAIGWNGTALAQVPACSRIIAAMIAGDDDEWGRSRLIDQPASSLPPEPVRYIGANLVRWGIVRKNRAEIANRRPSPFVRAVIRFMPKGSSEH